MANLIHYHAVMIDETGCEFGTSVDAPSRPDAYDLLREMYPESSCDQLESPADIRAREQDLYESIQRELDGEDWDSFDDEDEGDD